MKHGSMRHESMKFEVWVSGIEMHVQVHVYFPYVPIDADASISSRFNKAPPPEVGGATGGGTSPPSKSNSEGSCEG